MYSSVKAGLFLFWLEIGVDSSDDLAYHVEKVKERQEKRWIVRPRYAQKY
jgi:hypothetical protein